MKKKLSLFPFALAFAAMPLLTSCGDDNENDTTKPVISNLLPANHQKLQIGGDIHFVADISDNEGLKSYKIDIHNNFDGHSHSHTRAAADDSVAYTFTKTWTTDKEGGELLAGKRNTTLHHHEIVIPTHINGKPVRTGNYHFVLYVVDEAGNESFDSSEVVLSYEEQEDPHGHDGHDHDHSH